MIRHLTVLVVLPIIATAASSVAAQGGPGAWGPGNGGTHIYESDGNGTVRKVGVVKGGYQDASVLCSNGNCQSVICTSCHAAAKTTPTATQWRQHTDVYYPRAEVRLRSDESVAFAGMRLRRVSDRLEFVDRNGRRYRLPPGARLLKDRTNAPAMIIVPGTTLTLTAIR